MLTIVLQDLGTGSTTDGLPEVLEDTLRATLGEHDKGCFPGQWEFIRFGGIFTYKIKYKTYIRTKKSPLPNFFFLGMYEIRLKMTVLGKMPFKS